MTEAELVAWQYMASSGELKSYLDLDAVPHHSVRGYWRRLAELANSPLLPCVAASSVEVGV